MNFKILILFLPFSVGFETCSVSDKEKCGDYRSNKYLESSNRRYSHYLDIIQKTKKLYKPCDESNCSCHFSVLSSDLANFKEGITKEMLDNVRTKGTKYQIINKKLYRDKNCMFPARCSGIEYFILKLLPKLPDLELILNTRDWPQIHKNYGAFGPVFSFSKTQHYFDIMYPAWAFWEGGPAISLYPRGIGRWDKHREKLGSIGNKTSWEDKIPKAFFRGSRTSAERDPLILLSREDSSFVDAKYTKNQAWKSDADTLHEPPATEVSFEDHCQYKYLFNFRGVAASFRFKHLFLCKSLVFHVGNEWLEFFYPAMIPWYHYIPVDTNADQKQIKNLIEFAINNDDIAKEIAENGYNFIWEHLQLKDIFCYWQKLLENYADLLTFTPQLDEGLIEIKSN